MKLQLSSEARRPSDWLIRWELVVGDGGKLLKLCTGASLDAENILKATDGNHPAVIEAADNGWIRYVISSDGTEETWETSPAGIANAKRQALEAIRQGWNPGVEVVR